MKNIVDIDSARPHLTTSVECSDCGYFWVAVYPETANYLECPGCHNAVNEYGIRVSLHECKSCKRRFSICPANKDWGDECLSEDCETYDPSRDASRLFDD